MMMIERREIQIFSHFSPRPPLCFSELLRMVLFVLDEGVAHLETYVEFPGKQALQRSCLFALQARMTY